MRPLPLRMLPSALDPGPAPSAARRKNMAAIRSTNTTPEITVRKVLHAGGFRFRLHPRTMPGKPDLVLPRYRAAVFINGCFWHCHECSTFRWPATRAGFWRTKLLANRDRDTRVAKTLREDGWRVATVWECSLRPASRATLTIPELERWIVSDRNELELTE
jgi:DNA mismatch endonuclease (patch repair protein)